MKGTTIIRVCCGILVALIVAMMVAGCASYPGDRGSEIVKCTLRQHSRAFKDGNEARRAASQLSAEIGSYRAVGNDVRIVKASFAPLCLENGDWTLGAKLDYHVAGRAKPGKRSVQVEVLDRSDIRMAVAVLDLDVRRNKTDANRGWYILLAIVGLSWSCFCWVNRINQFMWSGADEAGRQRLKDEGVWKEPVPEGCARVFSLLGVAILLYSVAMILKGIFA